MKRFVCFIGSIVFCLSMLAQDIVQEGYVKTLGRPNVKGEALSGVSIKIKGEHNPVLSKKDGTFSILYAGKKEGDAYSLQEVLKKGYEFLQCSGNGVFLPFAKSDCIRNTPIAEFTKERDQDIFPHIVNPINRFFLDCHCCIPPKLFFLFS